jgi:hypothetical protein
VDAVEKRKIPAPFQNRTQAVQHVAHRCTDWAIPAYTRESKKLSALLFFQFIYTKVGVEQVRHFST